MKIEDYLETSALLAVMDGYEEEAKSLLRDMLPHELRTFYRQLHDLEGLIEGMDIEVVGEQKAT